MLDHRTPGSPSNPGTRSPRAAHRQGAPTPMAAPSSSTAEVEVESVDLRVAAELDPDTYKLFFSDDDAVGTEWSWPDAEAFASTLTQDDARRFCDMYGVPNVYTPVSASHLGWAASKTPAEGHNALCVYAAALEADLRFPLHPFYVKLLRHYRLAPSQLTPNSWTYMAAFVLLCEEVGVEPLVSAFRYFFTISAHRNKKGLLLGWFHFQPFPDGNRPRLFTGTLPSKNKWKSRYFFLISSLATSWNCPVKWGKPRRKAVCRQELTDTAIERLQARAGKTGIDLKRFLSQKRSRPVGRRLDLVQVQATMKAEARAAAGVESASTSTGKRKAPEDPVPPPPPLRQEQGGFAVMPTPRGFDPADQSTSGAQGGSEPPPGMWGSDALMLWELTAQKAQLQAALEEAKHFASTLMGFLHEQRAHLQAAQTKVTQLEAQVSGMAMEHAASVAQLEELKAGVARLEEEYKASVARLEEVHESGVARLKEYEAELARVKDAAAKYAQAAEARAKKNVVLALFPNLDPSLLEP